MEENVTKRKRQILRTRRQQLEKDLELALLENGQPFVIARLAEVIKAAKNIEQKYVQAHRRAIFLGFFVAAAAASLIGIGIYLKMPNAAIQLEVRATEMTFEAANSNTFHPSESVVMYSTAPLMVKRFSYESALTQDTDDIIEDRPLKIESIEIHRGTRIRSWYESPNCIAMKVLDPLTIENETGVVVQVGVLPDSYSNVIPPGPIYVHKSEIIRICGEPDLGAFLIGPTAALALTRIYKEETPRLEMSSILTGTVAISGISKIQTLSPNDRLILDDLEQTWLVIRRDSNAFHLSLSGRATAARVMGNSPIDFDGEDLIPSLLVFATQSPLLLILSLTVSLFGIFWNAMRWLGIIGR